MRSKIITIAWIVGSLLSVYLLSGFMLAGVGLANPPSDELRAFGSGLMFFIENILGFPLNLIDSKLPFLTDERGMFISNPILPVLLNFVLQVILIYRIIEILKRSLAKRKSNQNTLS